MAKETIKEEVKMVQVGQNLNLKLGEDKFTIKGTKDELAPAKQAVKDYEAKPTKANRQKVLELFKPRTTEVEGMKERIKSDKKKVANQIKEEAVSPKKKIEVKDVVKDIEDKEFTEEELVKMEEAIKKAKAKKASAPVAKTAPATRSYRGEY